MVTSSNNTTIMTSQGPLTFTTAGGNQIMAQIPQQIQVQVSSFLFLIIAI
jgi:hypothetical protein